MAERKKALVEKEKAIKDGQMLRKQLYTSKLEIEKLQTKIEEVSTDIEKVREQHENRFSDLKSKFESELEQKKITISELKDRITVVNVTAEILFSSGSAIIKPKGTEVLDLISETLKKNPNQTISIEGHTDNIPIIENSPFPTNWELSAARSAAAARYLLSKGGIEAGRMQVVGHGEHRPANTNETPEGRKANRRIEIIVLPANKK